MLLGLPMHCDVFSIGLACAVNQKVYHAHAHNGLHMLQTASTGVVDIKALPKLNYEFNALEPYVSSL